MTDVFVCVFFTDSDLASKKNACIRVSITLGWALPQGCSVLSQLCSIPVGGSFNMQFIFVWDIKLLVDYVYWH